MDAREVGQRVRRLRLVSGLGQVEFSERIGIATGSVSKLENGRMELNDDLLETIAAVVDCSPAYLLTDDAVVPTTRPWLRAYADAPKRAVDRQIADCTVAAEVIDVLGLKTIPDSIPVFDGELDDDEAIEHFALEVRAAAQLGEGDVVGHSIRAAERLGCLVLPMSDELGRHLGMSVRANLAPVICVSRPSLDPERRLPGDRQRFTVAHELGHLALHGNLRPPQTAQEAAAVERQAHRFAGAFLAPADAIVEELHELGGRVTLSTLTAIKERWGVAIKALVMRFQAIGVIDPGHARSLHKQISARGWNKNEPVPVGNEGAIWFDKALNKNAAGSDPILDAVERSGIGRSHLERWTDWSPTAPPSQDADVIELSDRPVRAAKRRTTGNAAVLNLQRRN